MTRTSEIANNIRFYLLSTKYNWKSFLAYRSQALSWSVIEIIGVIGTLISISVIYGVSNGLPGWTYFQLLAFAAITQISGGVFWYSIVPRSLVRSMRNGGLDQLLLKPYNPILTIFARFGDETSVGTLIGGAALLAYALSNSSVAATAIIVFIPMYVTGMLMLVLMALTIALASYIAFKDASYVQWTMNIANHAAQYPANIYGVVGMTVLSTLIPITFATFFPALVLFGKASYMYALPAIALAALASFVLYKVSSRLLKRYESASG